MKRMCVWLVATCLSILATAASAASAASADDGELRSIAANKTNLGKEMVAVTILTNRTLSGHKADMCSELNRPAVYLAVVYFINDDVESGRKEGCWGANDKGDIGVRIEDSRREFRVNDFLFSPVDESLPKRKLRMSDLPKFH